MAITEHIDNYHQLLDLASDRTTWEEVLRILSTMNNRTPEGQATLSERLSITVTIKRFNTQEPPCHQFEAHRKMVDLHLCLDGGEKIYTTAKSCLTEHSSYNPDTDTTLFYPLDNEPTVEEFTMSPGNLLLLFPADAHLPVQPDRINPTVLKVVVKIPRYVFK